MNLYEGFQKQGFLSEGIANGIPSLRAENAGWFKLAEDANLALMAAAIAAMKAVHTTSMAPEAVAVRVLSCSCAAFQGVILLIERGMVAEARMLARSLIENAFCIAALHDNASTFMQMLKDDSEASRRLQGNFIIAQNLIESGAARDKLKAAIDAIDKTDIMSPKKVAALGPLMKQYLAYQRLSDDAAHLSARSLHRHVERSPDRSGWRYKWGAGDQGGNATTLHHAISAVLGIGVGVTQLLKDLESNAAFGPLADRFASMPPVSVV